MAFFTASDGARIAYADSGSGRPVVLLHGLMAHRGFFDAQAPLEKAHRIITIDLRGHGETPAGPTPPTIARLAADVCEIAEALDLDNAIGVGWSLGATVLWHVLGGAESGRFAGAVVVDMTPRVRNGADWHLGLSEETCDARTAAIRDNYAEFATAAGQAIFAQPLAPHLAERAAWSSDAFARADGAAIGAIWQSLLEQDLRAALGRIRQPTLVIHGAHSHLYDAGTADHLVAALPDARAVRFEGSGHSPHIEQPELFNRTLADFAARVPHVHTHTDA